MKMSVVLSDNDQMTVTLTGDKELVAQFLGYDNAAQLEATDSHIQKQFTGENLNLSRFSLPSDDDSFEEDTIDESRKALGLVELSL